MSTLHTSRLDIIPFRLDLVRAAMYDRETLARLLDMEVPACWPGADFGDILPLVAEILEEDPGQAGWTRLIIHASDRKLIGDIGFLAPPDAMGTVELGYSIIPSYRRQGYAVEAARTMLDWAAGQPGVRRIIAACKPDNSASIRVLEKVGMRRVAADEAKLHWEMA